MPSLLSRLANLVPGYPRRAVPPKAAAGPQPPETPAARRDRLIAQTRQNLDAVSRRPRPSSDEKVPANYHGGVGGKVWFLPYADSATQDSPEIRAAMRLMLRDAWVKAAWLTQVLSVSSENLQVQAGEPGNPASEEQAKFFAACLNEHIDGGAVGLVNAIAMPLGPDGWSVCEKVWGVCDRGPHAGRIVPTAVKAKDSDFLRLEGDSFRNVTHVQSLRFVGERFPISDFLYTRYLPVFDEPLGMAAFRASYAPYWMRDTVRKLRVIHHEKRMAGMLQGEYEDEDDKPALEAALRQAKTATWMAVPKGCRVQAIALSTASEPDYKSFDESLREEIVTGITFATLQMMQGTVPDARGNSMAQKQTSDLAPWLLMSLVQDTINRQLAPDCIDFNYPYAAGGYPKVTFGAVAVKEMLDLINVVEGAQRIGLSPSRKYYANALSIQQADPNDPGDMLEMPGTGGPAPGEEPREETGVTFAERPGDPGPPGPPPRPGLVWKEATQRWIRKRLKPTKADAPSGAGESPKPARERKSKGVTAPPSTGGKAALPKAKDKAAQPQANAKATPPPAKGKASRPPARSKAAAAPDDASPEGWDQARAAAKRAIAAAPVPTDREVKTVREKITQWNAARQKARADGTPPPKLRQFYDARGSAAAHEERAQRIFAANGGEEKGYVVCHATGKKLHWTADPAVNPKGYAKFEQGKIFEAFQGGDYRDANVLAEHPSYNRARGRFCSPLRPENRERIDRSKGGGAAGPAPKDPIEPKARATAERWVGPALPEELQRLYARNLAHVLTNMPAPARAFAEEAIDKGSTHFYPNLKTLRAAASAISGKTEKNTTGLVVHGGDGSATLLADGGSDPAGTYAHELWHAVDLGHRYSSDPEWGKAYQRDIVDGKYYLSKYARKSASEAFAEFGMVLYKKGPNHMTTHFPKCWKFMVSKGLV